MRTQHVSLLLSPEGEKLFLDYVELAKAEFTRTYPEAEKPHLKPSSVKNKSGSILRNWFWAPCDTRDFQAFLIAGIARHLPAEQFKLVIVGHDITDNSELGMFDSGPVKLEFRRMTFIDGNESKLEFTPAEANLMASALTTFLWSLRRVQSMYGDYLADDCVYMIERDDLKTMLGGLKKLRTIAGPILAGERMGCDA